MKIKRLLLAIVFLALSIGDVWLFSYLESRSNVYWSEVPMYVSGAIIFCVCLVMGVANLFKCFED